VKASKKELDRNKMANFVFGSLSLRGDGSDGFLQRARRSLDWYKNILGRGAGAILYSLIHDIGYLFLDGDQFVFRTLYNFDKIPEKARDVRLSYENAFLNSLLRDPLMIRARMAIMHDESRDDLIIRAIQCVLAPLMTPRKPGYTHAPNLNPQLLRELSLYGGLKTEKHAAEYTQDEDINNDFFELALRESLSKLLARENYLDESDLAEIEHWDAYLGREDLRMAGRRIAHHASRIRPADRRRFNLVEEEPEVDSELSDAGTFPQGGFSELSTRGIPENLVPSELIYLGEGNITNMSQAELDSHRDTHSGEGTPTIIDLFAFRFVSNELLYYMRESGQLKRVRRTVHFVIEPDPPQAYSDEEYQGLRFKEMGFDDQYIVMVLGLAVRLAKDLSIIFSKDSVRFEIHIIAANHTVEAAAARDAQLLRVLLEHEIKHDKVEVLVQKSLDLRQTIDRSRRVYAISLQFRDLHPAGLPSKEICPKQLRCTILRLGGNTKNSQLKNVETVPIPLDEEFLNHIERARDGLLSEITGSRSRR
jgi:hypothetical protein